MYPTSITAIAPDAVNMFDYRNFDEMFDFDVNHSYATSTVESVERCRRSLEGLFVDRVLKLIGVKRPSKLYPPKSNSDLRSLHQTIVGADAADHTKLSLLYYVLLDCDANTRRRDLSDSFEERSSLPQRYQIFMKGLWHMDRLDFEIALQYLTHPSLIPTFHEEILETLVDHAKKNDMSLPLAYYYTVQPTLQNSTALGKLFAAITRTSVTEAYLFCQVQNDVSHLHMFEVLIGIVLSGPPDDITAARAVELVNLPFNKKEADWFEDYLTSGEGRSLSRAKDTLLMRRIATGRFSMALPAGELGSNSDGGLSWEMVQHGLLEGLGPRM